MSLAGCDPGADFSLTAILLVCMTVCETDWRVSAAWNWVTGCTRLLGAVEMTGSKELGTIRDWSADTLVLSEYMAWVSETVNRRAGGGW